MKKTLFFWLFVLLLIAGFCLAGCDDTPPEPEYLTQWIFKNDSDTSVNVTLIIAKGETTIDSSWSNSNFSVSPGRSITVGNYEKRDTIYYRYGPADKVTPGPYVNGSFTITFINI